jgi:hypothetical protein
MKIFYGNYYNVHPKQFVVIGIGRFHNCLILEFFNFFLELEFKKDKPDDLEFGGEE